MKKTKEKWEQYWYYYKGIWGTLISLLVILILLLSEYFLIDHREKYSVFIVNSSFNTEQIKRIENFFVENELIENEINLYIDTGLNFEVSQDNPIDFDQMGRFTTMVASGEMNVLIAPKDIIQHYVKLNGFQDLSNFSFVRTEKLDETHTMLNLSGTIFDGFFLGIPKKSNNHKLNQQFVQFIMEFDGGY